MGVTQNKGYLFGSPYTKGYHINVQVYIGVPLSGETTTYYTDRVFNLETAAIEPPIGCWSLSALLTLQRSLVFVVVL